MAVLLGLLLYITIIKLFMRKLDSNKKKKTFLLLSGIGIVLVMGCRYPEYKHVTDLKAYYDYYRIIGQLDWSNIFGVYSFEPGYAILNKFLSIFISWPQFILFFEGAFCVFCTSYFIYKNTDEVYDSLFLYITMGLFSFHLTSFRQSIAMSICLLSVELIKKRKFVPFLILVFLASTIHRTAILFIFAYFFINNDIDWLFQDSSRFIVI